MAAGSSSVGQKRKPVRKQGTACDACKLRKLKCSLSTAPVSRATGPSTSAAATAATTEACARCLKKSIACTMHLQQSGVPQSVYAHVLRDARRATALSSSSAGTASSAMQPGEPLSSIQTIATPMGAPSTSQGACDTAETGQAVASCTATPSTRAPAGVQMIDSLGDSAYLAPLAPSSSLNLDWQAIASVPLHGPETSARAVPLEPPPPPQPTLATSPTPPSASLRARISDPSWQISLRSRADKSDDRADMVASASEASGGALWSAADGRLAMSEQQKALSRHLINIYLHAVHMQYPVLDPDVLRYKFDRAQQDVNALDAATRVTCAAVEAWAARYSMHPIILGNQGASLSAGDSTSLVPAARRLEVGHARQDMCRALLKRAFGLLDSSGILRKPSLESLRAILLLKMLQIAEAHAEDDNDKAQEMYSESMMLNAAAVEQASVVREIVEAQSSRATPTMQLFEGRRLWWATWIDEAFFSATIGRKPRIDEIVSDDLGGFMLVKKSPLLYRYSRDVFVPPRAPQPVVLAAYANIGLVTRFIADEISRHTMRPSTASASSISLAAQTALSNLSLMMAQFDEGHAAIREQAKVAPPGFYGDGQPLTINLNVKLLIMSSALVLHTHLARRLEYERREAGRHARISGLEPVGADRAREGGGDHQALRVMQEAVASSTANSLNLAAVVVRTIEDDLPRGLFQNSSLLLINLYGLVEFLSEAPVLEQGFYCALATSGSCSSTTTSSSTWAAASASAAGETKLFDWQMKGEMLSVCLEALSQASSAWPAAHTRIARAVQSMHQHAPASTPGVRPFHFAPRVYESRHAGIGPLLGGGPSRQQAFSSHSGDSFSSSTSAAHDSCTASASTAPVSVPPHDWHSICNSGSSSITTAAAEGEGGFDQEEDDMTLEALLREADINSVSLLQALGGGTTTGGRSSSSSSSRSTW